MPIERLNIGVVPEKGKVKNGKAKREKGGHDRAA
jgi:hypothetical protein